MRIPLKNTFDILYYTPRFYPAIAGAEFYILNLALQMHQVSRKTQVLCSTAIDYKGIRSPNGQLVKPTHPAYSSYKNIPILRVPSEYSVDLQDVHEILRISKFPNDFPYNKLLETGPNHTKYFLDVLQRKSWNIKLIHSTYLPYATILFALFFSRKMDIPSVCTPFYHIYNPRYQDDSYISLLDMYDRIISCTQTEAEFLIRKGIKKNKIATIPMGVDYKIYNSPVKTRSGKLKSFKKAFAIKKPFVLYCGYKNYEKGAISVLKAAKTHSADLAYVFIGPSTIAFDIELKKTRSQGITVYNITPDNLQGYYDWRKISAFQECEFFIMPSRSDAYGIAYLEAWASKKPVIGADSLVMRDVIQHGNDGLLVEFNNPSQIADSIRILLEDKEKSKEMGLVGYQKIKKNNTWEVVHKKTIEVYNELTDLKQ